MAGYQMAMSRNRATEGRASKNPLDIYMQKGQIVARQMPMSRVDFPSDAQVRNTASVVREREIEKQLDLGDVMALRWRANKSRYNWWEILGKIYISQEFNFPGTVAGLNRIWFRPLSSRWMIYVYGCYPSLFDVLDFGSVDEYQANHYWRYATHREAGMVEQHRGIEVLRYKLTPQDRPFYNSGLDLCMLMIDNRYAPVGHIIMIRAYEKLHTGRRGKFRGATGLLYWTATDPWWLDAPFPFMP